MKKFLSLLFVLCMCVGVAACGKETDEEPPISSVNQESVPTDNVGGSGKVDFELPTAPPSSGGSVQDYDPAEYWKGREDEFLYGDSYVLYYIDDSMGARVNVTLEVAPNYMYTLMSVDGNALQFAALDDMMYVVYQGDAIKFVVDNADSISYSDSITSESLSIEYKYSEDIYDIFEATDDEGETVNLWVNHNTRETAFIEADDIKMAIQPLTAKSFNPADFPNVREVDSEEGAMALFAGMLSFAGVDGQLPDEGDVDFEVPEGDEAETFGTN